MNGLSYLEPIAVFLAEDDAPTRWIFPDLLPTDVLMLVHGEPRARKSLVALELAMSAATGTAPFGLGRFQPSAPAVVMYVQEEDARSLTRPRLRRLIQERCGASTRILSTYWCGGASISMILRGCRGSPRTSIGSACAFWCSTPPGVCPSKPTRARPRSRELIAVLRSIVTSAGVTIVIVHHDVKPPANGQDMQEGWRERASSS